MAKKQFERVTSIRENELRVELIPVYENSIDFQKRKNEIQEMIAKMIILAKTRGRPRGQQEEEQEYAA